MLDAYSFVGAVRDRRGARRRERSDRVDESALALEVGARVRALNGLANQCPSSARTLDALDDAKLGFDIVLLDPPRLAPTRGAHEKALLRTRSSPSSVVAR